MTGPDLLSCDAAYDGDSQIAWYPRASHERSQAHNRFQRELRLAGWQIDWRQITVVARYLKQNPNDPEGYIECQPQEAGATPVWRCALSGQTLVSGNPFSPLAGASSL